MRFKKTNRNPSPSGEEFSYQLVITQGRQGEGGSVNEMRVA